MTAFGIIAFIAFLWIAHGFWVDLTAPLTKNQQELIKTKIQTLELDLFHKRLYLQELACPWKPTVKLTPQTKRTATYKFGNGNIIDLELSKTQALIFISAESKLAYLKSTEWYSIRAKRLTIAQHKCECCGSTESLQCHHITYQRLTMEHIDDIVILCGGSNGCHQRIHDLLGYDRTTEYPISTIKD